MPVVRIESSSGGEMPALLNATCRPPCRSTTPANIARTCSSSVTSTWTKSPPTSFAAWRPGGGVDVGAHHGGALAREPPRGGEADPAARTGDDGDLAVEASGHVSYSFVEMNTFLVSVNASGASGPSSRPRPEDLKPPNGVQ